VIERFFTILTAAALATAAHADALPMRSSDLASAHAITPGSWNITFDDGTQRRICLQDINPLIQLSHPGPQCGRLFIQDEADRAIVHYTCPGAGWGRTTLLVETPRLVRINSQGIAARTPFAFDAEARRIGECDAPPLRRPR